MEQSKTKKAVRILFIGAILGLISAFGGLSFFGGQVVWLTYFSFLGLLSIPAFILEIIGIVKLGSTSHEFATARLCFIMSLVFSVIGTTLTFIAKFIENGSLLYNISQGATALGEVLSFIATFSIIIGIMVIASEQGKDKLAAFGNVTRWLYLSSALLGIIFLFLISFLPIINATLNETVFIVLLIASVALDLVSELAYLIYLGKAQKNLD